METRNTCTGETILMSDIKAIRERHEDEQDKLNRFPSALGPKQRFVEAHKDRGKLIGMVDELQAKLGTKYDASEFQRLFKIARKEKREAEATIERVREEYLNHVKSAKSPVMVLDAIGWILAIKDNQR